MNFWHYVYHLCGLTLLDVTREEPLGTLPLPIRSAALAAVEQEFGPDLHIEWGGDPVGGATARYVKSWRRREHGASASLKPPITVHEYYQQHGLLPNGDRHDEHFAERMFVERVFVPLFGLGALSRLQPQVAFTDPGGKARAIDFVLDNGTGKRYAVEIEGRTYHQAPEGSARFREEKFRQRALVLADYLYIPIAYSEIEQGNAQAAREDLLRLVESNEELHRNLDAQWLTRAPQSEAETAVLRTVFEVLPVRWPFYQAYVLGLLREATENRCAELRIAEEPGDGPLLLLALLDLLVLAERVAAIYGVELSLPTITYIRCTAGDSAYDAIVAAYLGAQVVVEGAQPDNRRDRFSRLIHITSSAQGGSARRRAGAVTDSLAALRRQFGSEFPAIIPFADTDAQSLAPLLDYFARRYFPVPELKPEQQKLLQRALAGRASIGILPTGFGKSLVFQLYALLIPGTTLVVSPLKSLIHDQLASMHRLGLGCVEAISSSDAAASKQWKLQQMAAHRVRLLYVAPERLRIKAFYDEMFPAGKQTPICALFIDEVHCISEWGHDFRPAYLAIKDLVQRLSQARGSTVTVTGLTATASRDVRADILEVLGLAADDVVQLSSSDRANLSLSVHRAPERLHAKAEIVTELLRTTLPMTLAIPAQELLFSEPGREARYSGVIFGMYANSHGKTMIDEGVHQIAQELRKGLGLGADAVGIHASTAPSICPECGSTTFVSRNVTGNGQQYGARRSTRIYECKDCKATFAQPKTINKDTWQEQLEQVQDSFYRGDFPLMVATKSYGMGIDKRNIRYIIHHALAGGMEGYYQEAGRAGRDGKPAHVALVCKLPHRDCYENYLVRELPPPCITDETNRQYNKCPYFTSGLCDAGRQAYFIAKSYPGVERDAKQVVSTYRALRDAKDAGLQVRTKSGDSGEDDAVKEAELALFRLQQLGLITNYTIEYQPPFFARLMVERCGGWDGDTVLRNLLRFLQHSGMTQEAAEHAVAALRPQSWEQAQKPSAAARDSFLEAAATILLQRVYDRVPRMRYTMLSSLLRYAFNDQNRCRRLYIRTYFDAHPPDDNYRCEYCDACRPDLVFDRQEAVTPAADRQLDYITGRLHLILATFDSEELRQVIATAEAKVAVVSLFEKANRVLEDDATNVAALFLTGALARRQRGLEGLARERLRFAFAEGERQGLATSQLHAIYAEASALDGPFAVELISRKQGAYDSPEGLVLLEQVAAEVYGGASSQRRAVRSLRRVRALRTLHSDVALAAEAVSALQEQLKEAHLQN